MSKKFKVAESLAAEMLAEPHGRVAMKAVHRLVMMMMMMVIMMMMIIIIMIIIIYRIIIDIVMII